MSSILLQREMPGAVYTPLEHDCAQWLKFPPSFDRMSDFVRVHNFFILFRGLLFFICCWSRIILAAVGSSCKKIFCYNYHGN